MGNNYFSFLATTQLIASGLIFMYVVIVFIEVVDTTVIISAVIELAAFLIFGPLVVFLLIALSASSVQLVIVLFILFIVTVFVRIDSFMLVVLFAGLII